MNTPTAARKSRATRIPAVTMADTDNRGESQETAPADGTLPSAGRGEIAAMNSEGQPTAPAGAQVPAGESTALALPAPETGEVEEAEAAAASSADPLMEWRPEDNPPGALAGGVIRVSVNEHIFSGWLVVSGPPEGRRRAGRRFGPTPTPLRAEDLTSDQLAGLYADPLLTIRAS